MFTRLSSWLEHHRTTFFHEAFLDFGVDGLVRVLSSVVAQVFNLNVDLQHFDIFLSHVIDTELQLYNEEVFARDFQRLRIYRALEHLKLALSRELKVLLDLENSSVHVLPFIEEGLHVVEVRDLSVLDQVHILAKVSQVV